MPPEPRSHNPGHPAQLQSMESNANFDADGHAVTGGIKSWLRFKRFRSALFPFLIFRYPESRPYHSHLFLPISWYRLMIGKDTPIEIADDAVGKEQPLYAKAFKYGVSLLGILIVSTFFVYICFSFNGDAYFPTVGSELDWVLVFRNVVMISLTHHLCLGLVHPNRERLQLLLYDMKKVDENLAYVGFVHTFRKFGAWWTRREFKMRWFTTFLSDSILLGFTYFFYMVYCILLMAGGSDAAHVLAQLLDIYRGCLTCGFIIYTLEFAPRVSPRKQAFYSGIIMLTVAMQWTDFFLFIKAKKDQSPVERFFGAVAQLFITHSSVLLSAIHGGHHQEAQLTPDLPWRGVLKITCVFAVAALWLVYSILREGYGYSFEGEHLNDWIAVSYPWVYWALTIVGGFGCAGMTLWYSNLKDTKPIHLVHLRGNTATFDQVERQSLDSESSESSESSAKDFDVRLITFTFTVTCVYFAAEIYANFKEGFWITGLYFTTSPIAIIGLCAFVATVWWNPPSKPLLALYAAMFLACCLVCSVQTFEDCHANASVAKCCEYPWLPDSNHHLEEPHGAPRCSGLHSQDGICFSLLAVSDTAGGETSVSKNMISLAFTAVEDTTRAIDIHGTKNGVPLWSIHFEDPSDILRATVCRANTITHIVHGVEETYPPGCSGEYLYVLPDSVVESCDPSKTSGCKFEVRTYNCAYIESEPLFIVPVYINSSDPSSMQAIASNLDLTEFSIPEETDVVESDFYVFFRLVGMAGFVECVFTLFGIIMKLIFLSECRFMSAKHASQYLKQKTNVIVDLNDDNRLGTIPEEDPDEGPSKIE